MRALQDFGPVAGWIISTITLGAMIWKWLRKPIQDFNDMKRHTRENWESLLRLQVWSSDLPLAERVDAGAEYVKYGGNGATKAKHIKNLTELERQVGGK